MADEKDSQEGKNFPKTKAEKQRREREKQRRERDLDDLISPRLLPVNGEMSPLSKLIAEGPSYPPVTDEELEEIKNSPMSAEARALIDYFDSRARYIENWVARIVAEAAEKKALASNGDAPTVTADNKHADCDAPKPASSWLKRILKNENSQDKGKA